MKVTFDEVSYFYNYKKQSRASIFKSYENIFHKKKNNTLSQQTGKYWALKDISFEARQGDIIGVVGTNGSGKSTMIKLISRIYLPDSGKVEIEGRLSTLLSLGTGQLQNLTGRENINITGLLLGMTKSEINAMMDDIIDFSDLADFIDQPVRTYSSGMKSRLGFATLMYANSDILLLDEIFAVGDNIFKEKAKKAMHEKIENTKITFIVSHSLNLITSVCNKAMWLNKGKMEMFGEVDEVVSAYKAFTESANK